ARPWPQALGARRYIRLGASVPRNVTVFDTAVADDIRTHQWVQRADDQVSEEHVEKQLLVRPAGAICQCPQALAISAADEIIEARAGGVQFLVARPSPRGRVRAHAAIVRPPPCAC